MRALCKGEKRAANLTNDTRLLCQASSTSSAFGLLERQGYRAAFMPL